MTKPTKTCLVKLKEPCSSLIFDCLNSACEFISGTSRRVRPIRLRFLFLINLNNYNTILNYSPSFTIQLFFQLSSQILHLILTQFERLLVVILLICVWFHFQDLTHPKVVQRWLLLSDPVYSQVLKLAWPDLLFQRIHYE